MGFRGEFLSSKKYKAALAVLECPAWQLCPELEFCGAIWFGGTVLIRGNRKALKGITVVVVVLIMVAGIYVIGFTGRKGTVHVIYAKGQKLYGLSNLLSEYDIIVNVTGSSTVEGTWSSPWHIMPSMDLNAWFTGNSTSNIKAYPIINRTGPRLAALSFRETPPPSAFPTNGSFVIRITFLKDGRFTMSGHYTYIFNQTVFYNASLALPPIALKYGLLLDFVFIYPTNSTLSTPYLLIARNFIIISG